MSGDVVPARAQMASTLGFHVILACLGIALPTFVLLAEYIGLRHSNEVAMTLARRWSQAMGVLVAVGAVTGTVLSFEIGLLWPGLMRRYGAVLALLYTLQTQRVLVHTGEPATPAATMPDRNGPRQMARRASGIRWRSRPRPHR
ncbi:cytochrome ubiquinol oxidase subunit I [Jatrophihabitans sp. DSM 45814]